MKIETFDLRSAPREGLRPAPASRLVRREAHQGNAKSPLAKKAWYDLLTDVQQQLRLAAGRRRQAGTTQWTMDGDAELTLKAEVRAQDDDPYWALYDVSVSGDLAIQSPDDRH